MAKINFNPKNPLYIEDLAKLFSGIDISRLKDKVFIITGASGLIGSLIIDGLMFLNKEFNSNIMVHALARSQENLNNRFRDYLSNKNFICKMHDIRNPIPIIKSDFIINAAGNSYPKAFVEHPIDTLLSNIEGTKNILNLSKQTDANVLILSSGEIYGDNRNNDLKMDENYTGNLDLNSLRACYPEGKRASEALCKAYIAEYGVKIKIARLCRVFGPTMTDNDNRVFAQFFRCAKNKENLVLKSSGLQRFSFIYGIDAINALLHILLDGINGESYNVASDDCDCELREFAINIANIAGVKIMMNNIGEVGGSLNQNALLDNSKLKNIGWKPQYKLKDALKNTLDIIYSNGNR